MEPQRYTESGLVDLLDRLLDKGLVLNADIIIGIADVPLIGISLRAAIAAIETMLDYGMFQDWEEAILRQKGARHGVSDR